MKFCLTIIDQLNLAYLGAYFKFLLGEYACDDVQIQLQYLFPKRKESFAKFRFNEDETGAEHCMINYIHSSFPPKQTKKQ